MRAAVIDPSAGTLQVTDVADPTPKAGQLLVRVKAAGLNRADLAMRTGSYVVGAGAAAAGVSAAPPRLMTAGGELAGEVVAVGDGVTGWAVGDRVMGQGAGYAELAVVDTRLALPVPPALTWEEAGSLPVALLTMHDALVTNGRWAVGESVLVHAVTSGVGVIGAQLALYLGAPLVLGTSRTPDKRERLAALLDDERFVALHPADLVRVAAEATGDHGVDVTIDNVGAAVIADTVTASAIKARIVQVGRLGGRMGTFDLDELARKRISLIGVTFRTRTMDERVEVVRAAWADLADAVADGALRPPVHAVYGLDDAAVAQDALARDEHLGKIVIVP